MGFFSKLKGEFVDIVEWLDSSTDTMAYRFPRYENEIKNGARLVVRESQIAVFINQGVIADVFLPGIHTLTTQNLPILSTLQGWKHGFSSPFKAEVYFVSTRNITGQKWGTKNPVTLNDKRYGMIEMRAFGTYAIRVKDAAVFIREIVGTDGHFTADKISEQLKSIIVTRFTNAAGQSNIPIDLYASQLSEASAQVYNVMKPEFEEYGIELSKLVIENVSMPDTVKDEIFEYTRLDAINLERLTKIKAAKAIETAAGNDGTAGAGIGYAMAGMMGQLFAGVRNIDSDEPLVAQTPPAIPTSLSFFIAVNGEQAGPYDLDVLKQMANQAKFTKTTLVWQAGMDNWTPAGQLPELKFIFETVPPPIPG